ncbi:MAG: alpha/beta hydrolase [Micrococcales bacterium]
MKKKLISILVALPLLITGCAVAPAATPAAVADVSAALTPFYSQTLTWKTCGDIKCATIKAPLNWDAPSMSSAITLALNYAPSTGAADKGWLLENPGGPGGSGVDFVKGGGAQMGSETLRKHYNVVGFDPRGVGSSSKVVCLNAAQTDKFLYDPTPGAIGSTTEFNANVAAVKAFATACKKNTGALLGHVDTTSAARDLDLIRALLGESKLNYLGFSYGTFLGATYAALYPQNVGRFVLDGAIDPTVSDEDSNAYQLKAFDTALHNYLNNCLTVGKTTCPFSGSVDNAMATITAFYRKLETTSIKTTLGRKLQLPGAITGLIMTLYSNDYWKYTSAAFSSAFKGDGTLFLELADAYNDRNNDGTYASNMLEANMAINCLDGRSNPSKAAMNAQNARLAKLSPFFGRYWRNGALGCASWPYKLVPGPANYSAAGSGPIIVVGTTGDPATPYWEAQNLANKILANGHLITFNGEGHTAYGRSNSCVVDAVDAYLVNGIVPVKDPNC